MKNYIKYWPLLTMLLWNLVNVPVAHTQGFVNLNFESATIVPVPGDSLGRVQFGPAFPGWTAYYNSTAVSSASPILYNDPLFASSTLSVLDRNYAGGAAISNFTAGLQSGAGSSQPSVSLAQTGLVPADSLSLRFMARSLIRAGINGPETFIVSMNGLSLTCTTLENFGSFRLYGADISAFAGQTAELRFTQPSGPTLWDNLFLDNISFSPVAVPEPGTWALLGLGGALLWGGVRRRKK